MSKEIESLGYYSGKSKCPDCGSKMGMERIKISIWTGNGYNEWNGRRMGFGDTEIKKRWECLNCHNWFENIEEFKDKDIFHHSIDEEAFLI